MVGLLLPRCWLTKAVALVNSPADIRRACRGQMRQKVDVKNLNAIFVKSFPKLLCGLPLALQPLPGQEQAQGAVLRPPSVCCLHASTPASNPALLASAPSSGDTCRIKRLSPANISTVGTFSHTGCLDPYLDIGLQPFEGNAERSARAFHWIGEANIAAVRVWGFLPWACMNGCVWFSAPNIPRTRALRQERP